MHLENTHLEATAKQNILTILLNFPVLSHFLLCNGHYETVY